MRSDTIGADEFSRTMRDILGDIEDGMEDAAAKAVQYGVRRGAVAWRKKARDLGWKVGDHTYKKHGEVITTGKYVRSIRSHMIVKDGQRPTGEVGSPKMPGLPHLLEFGHAKVGGGRVPAYPHVHDASEVAFDETLSKMGELTEEALHAI